jgi:hypothetical protein
MRARPATVILLVGTALGLWAVSPASLTARTLVVDARPDYTRGVRTVGVAPIRCTGKLDCDVIEAKVAEVLRERTGWRVIEAGDVEEEMDPWRDRRDLPGNMAALARDVGADAILTVELLPRGPKEHVQLQVAPLGGRCAAAARRSLVGGDEMLQVHLLSGRTGVALLQGVAVGRSVAGRSTGRTVRALTALLEKAFGE